MTPERRAEIRALAEAHAADEGAYAAIAAALIESENITDAREQDYLTRECRRAQRVAGRP
jgi:hypothetical protein